MSREQLRQKYKEEIEQKFDWKELLADAKKNLSTNFDGEVFGCVYIGTVMALTPSGKYYTPFANSNVDSCPKCNGKGKVENPNRNDAEYKELTGEIEKIDIRHIIETHGPFANWPEDIRQDITRLRASADRVKPREVCEHCDGVGSREALEDEAWYEALEEVCAGYGAWYQTSEGCATDILICVAAEEEEVSSETS